ncbi:MAG: LytTR family DNA-binding domain-containing protein [Bacteroidota bacterium]
MNCIALDDEPLALKVVEHYIQQIDWLHPQGFFTDPFLARTRLNKGGIDLLLLDIQMPDVTGLQFFTHLPKKPLVIFSTAYREFAVEGFELEAIDYIVKPYEFERFKKAVEKAKQHWTLHQDAATQSSTAFSDNAIFVRSTYKLVKIDLNDLYLIETMDDYLQLHLLSQDRPVLTLMTLKEMENMLSPKRFMRVHRSFIVALSHVEGLRRKKLSIQGREVPVGTTFLQKTRELFR